MAIVYREFLEFLGFSSARDLAVFVFGLLKCPRRVLLGLVRVCVLEGGKPVSAFLSCFGFCKTFLTFVMFKTRLTMAKTGRPRKIESPDDLWQLAEDYFAWIDSTPFKKNTLITSGELAGVIVPVPTIRPYSWQGLDIFAFERFGIKTLEDYKTNRLGTYGEYSEVIARISKKMYSQKFEGAAVNAFNANIIAADLGLAQKTIAEVKDITDEIDYSKLSDAALEEIEHARSKAGR